MSTHVGTLEEFVDILCETIDNLTTHSFTAKSQAAFLRHQKETLQDDKCIVICDFAENYQYVIQDEVQSYHWNKEYCTLHPVSLYYICQGELKTESLCVLSDDNNHDTPFVHKCLQLVTSHIKNKLPQVTMIEYFTDGCGGQYKNYKNFLNVCEHGSDFGLQACWNFFATSHGKGPCDGIGGTVKRLAYLESLHDRKTEFHPITTIDNMYKFCESQIANIKFFLVKAADMDRVRRDQNERFKRGSTVPGTQSFHQFFPIDLNTIGYKRLSSDTIKQGQFCFQRGEPSSAVAQEIKEGRYVAAVYDQEWYVGLVESVDRESGECMVNFMHPKMPTGHVNWPTRPDKCLTPLCNLLTEIKVPSSTSAGSRSYRISDIDLENIKKCFTAFIHKNDFH